ncbi:MAG: glycosyltransferase family 39 protein [Hyphomonadaceae bacterium]|nr:glycosyltransferase family 39 protein [Hyphomonadaceae bacterium]
MAPNSLFSDTLSKLAIAIIAGLLAMRVLLVLWSPLELYADEAQYWRWGQSLEWGYYSKPPMIAWMIHVSTTLFGDSEAAIRIFAPLFHAVSAFVLLLLSRRMFGPMAGLFTTVAYLFMPGIVLSSGVISTDGVLFPFWCTALYLFWRLRENDLGWLGVAALGIAMGAGFLSKYAMLYFAIGIALTSLIDRDTRAAVLSQKGVVALLIAAAVFAPHMLWNAANEFKTVSHTVDNANLGGQLFNLENFPKFLGDQLGVFGPVSFIALLAGLTFVRPRGELADLGDAAHAQRTKENWLACFIVPVLLIIAFQAVLSRAHANWAATAYPAASVWIGGFLIRAKGWRIAFWSGLAFQGAVGVLATVVALGPPSWTAAIGRDNDLKRVRGWNDLSRQLQSEIDRLQPTAILVDEREVWHGIDYYLKDTLETPLIMWRYNPGPKSYAEGVDLAQLDHSRVLVASYRSNLRPPIQADFATWQPEGAISVDLGHRSNGCPIQRELRLYLVSDYDPLPRTTEWTQAFKTEDEDGNLVDRHIDRPAPCTKG